MTESNKLNQFKMSETEFDNEVFYTTYLYNQINVFVDSYDLEEGLVELTSCDERELGNGELSVVLTIEEFVQSYLQ